MEDKLGIAGTIMFDSADPVTVEVTRGQRGGYGWTIKVKGSTSGAVIEQIEGIDQQLRNKYAGVETP
jgi:hypothetical protein